jgi:hypothetical protein
MRIRLAVPEDALAVARVHVRSWQVGYRGLLPDDYLGKLNAAERAKRYTFGRSEFMNGNTRGQRFYESDGWTPDGARKTEQIWGAEIDAIRYARDLR